MFVSQKNLDRSMTVEEYNKCVDLYSDGIYRFALKMLKNTELAQDNVQDSYEKLWVKHAEVDSAKAKSYLFTTSYNASVDTLRKEKRQESWRLQHCNIPLRTYRTRWIQRIKAVCKLLSCSTLRKR